MVCKDAEFVRVVAQIEREKHRESKTQECASSRLDISNKLDLDLLGVLQCQNQIFRTSLTHRDDESSEEEVKKVPEKLPGWVDLQHLIEELCTLRELQDHPLSRKTVMTEYHNFIQSKVTLHTSPPTPALKQA